VHHPLFDEPSPLSEQESFDRIPAAGLAHVACTIGAMPVVLPVRYERGDNAVTFRAEGGPRLAGALDGAVLALSVDADPWTVLLVGTARLLSMASGRGEVVVTLLPQIAVARAHPLRDGPRMEGDGAG
jgi:hypothetical protein